MKLPSKSQSILSKEEAFAKLNSIGQENLLKHWETLTAYQKENLTRQISYLDIPLFLRCRNEMLNQGEKKKIPKATPFTEYSTAGNLEDEKLGFELVKEGKVALVVLAGGQGSRLRFDGPKGCFGITHCLNKSLYQLLAEKIKAANKQLNRSIEVAIMTSPLNHVETQTFFVKHAFFGLHPAQITFFYQKMWPLLNFQGDLFLEEKDQIARGPNGNGGVFQRLVEWEIWKKWQKMGVEMVNVIPIDNPLADPFDFELFGFHARNGKAVTIKAGVKRKAEENVGVLGLIDEKPAIIEYLELSDEDKFAEKSKGELKFALANLGLYCFSMPFIYEASKLNLPLHSAKKAVKWLNEEGKTVVSSLPNAWKFEEFIFDVFPVAPGVKALLYPRQSCFAPLKNLKGEDSIDTVRAALLAYDRQVFAKVTGNEPPPDAVFELAPQFYYPTEELLKKWRGKPFPNKDYIHE